MVQTWICLSKPDISRPGVWKSGVVPKLEQVGCDTDRASSGAIMSEQIHTTLGPWCLCGVFVSPISLPVVFLATILEMSVDDCWL
uniref:Uncharacterized protein n=1 Tax=Arundo donax TaxID=35708 RepID=A0A0A9A9I5_ARUDO